MLEVTEILRDSLAGSSPAWLFLVFFFGTFISEDATCILAGTAVSNGAISFELALLSCLLGIFAGDVLLFAIGRFVGPPVFELGLIKRITTAERLKKVSLYLTNNAASAIFLSRFVSGLRLPTYLLAGALRSDLKKFTFYFLLAATIWTPLLVGSAAFAQSIIFRGNVIAGLIVTTVLVRFAVKFGSWKNRRSFVGRAKRIINWEFWPLGVFYFPVMIYVVWLSFRFRGLVFTAANPAMPASGFVGESKSEIYRIIETCICAKHHMLAFCSLAIAAPLDERFSKSAEFIGRNRLSFPLVLKPDVGERGKGVKIVENDVELRSAIAGMTEDAIIQVYAEGVEASIFYYRHPGKSKGQIFSITEKVFPFVVGDGISDLETLILRDKRAVCLAAKYFEHNRDLLRFVPAIGEKFQLIDIGTHSRGAIFKDGDWLRTAKLEQRLDEICRGISGFYFGRFDLRAASFEELMQGEFKIVELNGVTSESTNIYDSRYSLFDAYRILFKQWKIAFYIGAANRALGHRFVSPLELLRLSLTGNVSALEKPLPGQEICA